MRLAPVLLALAVVACGGSESSLSPQAALGEKLFFDRDLSSSSTQSCASCHDPDHAHAPPNALAFQPSADGTMRGLRTTPSLRYLFAAGAFRFDGHGKPVGGFFRDGRAPSLAEQAKAPLLSAREMGMGSAAAVARRIATAPYWREFAALYGADVLDDPERALDAVAQALQRYQLEERAFRPFDSKFDAVQAGLASFTAAEARGRAIFADPARGNCAACHPSTPAPDGTPALFTDFSYDSLGVPRNPAAEGNADPAHFDLGLCQRDDLSQRFDLCGAFKVPTLRNVATRRVFFHNGVFGSLEDVLRFYVTRDTHPERWYPEGGQRAYDDLPPELRGNVNTSEAPYGRRRGEAPALNDDELADLAAFLRTLTDGWRP